MSENGIMACKEWCFIHYFETCPSNKAVTSVFKEAKEHDKWRQEQSKKPVSERCREAREYLRRL